MRHRLKESNLAKLPCGIHSDGDGLYMRVRETGSRQWYFIYRRGTQRTEIGLGGWGQGTAPVSLKLAREKAEALRDKLARGVDPREGQRETKVKPKTFSDCMEMLLASKSTEWKNDKHRAQWEMTLRKYAAPLHEKAIADIVVGDVVETLTPHWTVRPETADRTRQRIEAVIDFGIAHGWRTAGNCARWKGLLDKLLPARKKLSRGHHAAVAYANIPRTAQNLRASSGVGARATEFAMLTAARSGEVRGATFGEVDTEARIWRIPAERMKSGRPHEVPLCERALAIVEAMRQRATGELIFGGYADGRPISDVAMVKALRLASPDKAATLHGLRSSFRDWAGDATDTQRDVAEAALAHVVSDKTEAAYRRGTALEKRRVLMEQWASYCAGSSAAVLGEAENG